MPQMRPLKPKMGREFPESLGQSNDAWDVLNNIYEGISQTPEGFSLAQAPDPRKLWTYVFPRYKNIREPGMRPYRAETHGETALGQQIGGQTPQGTLFRDIARGGGRSGGYVPRHVEFQGYNEADFLPFEMKHLGPSDISARPGPISPRRAQSAAEIPEYRSWLMQMFSELLKGWSPP